MNAFFHANAPAQSVIGDAAVIGIRFLVIKSITVVDKGTDFFHQHLIHGGLLGNCDNISRKPLARHKTRKFVVRVLGYGQRVGFPPIGSIRLFRIGFVFVDVDLC